MNSFLARNVLRGISFLRGQPIFRALEILKESQWWDLGRLKEYQEEKFRKLIGYCHKEVPFYKEYLNQYGIDPGRLGLETIARLPLIDKRFLRENLRQFTDHNYSERYEKCRTSGSTGVALQFPKSLNASAYQLGAMLRGHGWHGVEIGAKEAKLWGMPVNPLMKAKMRLIDILLNRFREREYNITEEVLEDFYKRLQIRRPIYLMGYTRMVIQFAKYLGERNIDGREFALKMVKCTSETILDEDRELIRRIFGCPLISEYGAGEAGLIAFECEQGSQHLMSECCFVEFLDPQEEIADKSLKEVVVTNLDNYAMPVIRYRIGDLAIPSANSCRCGRGLPTIERVVGRLSDVIRTSDGGQWHSMMLYYIMKGLQEKHGGIIQFKVFQREVDKLEFNLVKDHKFNESSEAYLRAQCQKQFGQRMRIDLRFVESIQREPSGKIRHFVSMI